MVKNLSYKDLESKFTSIQTEMSIKENQFNKLIHSFLSKISYEIRTPMNVIVGFSNLLNDQSYSQEQRDFFIWEINKNCNELLRLIDSFILSAKIETEELLLNFNVYTVASMMDELNTELNNNFEKQSPTRSNINLRRDQNGINYKIFTDKEKFLQVMSTLIKRASLFNRNSTITFGFNINDEKFVEFFIDTNQVRNADIEINQNNDSSEVNDHYNSDPVSALGFSDKLIRLLGGNLKIKTILGQGSSYHFTIPLLVEKPV
jgi:signal transduction histidine kinase